MLVAAVGCNLAWGIIQGWLFVLDKLFERGRLAKLALEVQESTDEGAALEMIRDEHDPDLDKVASVEERARLYLHILDNVKATPVARTRLRCGDLAGAFVVFLLVSLTAVPAVVPFLLIDDLRTALRVSNFLLVSLLFLVGHQWAAITNMNRWTTGLSIMVVGIGMVAIGEALGG
jgi:VIT1/CCC1 family predicted Fe2+/Mn2+ transporter